MFYPISTNINDFGNAIYYKKQAVAAVGLVYTEITVSDTTRWNRNIRTQNIIIWGQ